MEKLGDDLWDAPKEYRQLLRGWVTLLENSLLAATGEAAGESPLQNVMGKREERAVPSALGMVEEVSGEDEELGPRANLLLGHHLRHQSYPY